MPKIANLVLSISREDAAWLAGLYDGEGCLSQQGKTKHRYWVLAISMTDEDVVRRAYEVTKAGCFMGPLTCPSLAKYKPVYRWSVNSQQAIYEVTRAMLPWLGERRSAKVAEFVADYEAREARRLICSKGLHQRQSRGGTCNSCAAAAMAVKRAAKKATTASGLATK